MLAIDRLKRIEELLLRDKSVVVSQLSTHFHVSEETIRRDLDKLSTTVQFRRVRGGAYLEQPSDSEVPITIREQLYLPQKQAIAERAVSTLRDGQVILLDSSTTALAIAQRIRRSPLRVTVVSNSLRIISEAGENDALSVIALGGEFRRQNCSYVGYLTTDALARLSADVAFISCTMLHPRFGITDSHPLEARVRQLMVERAEKRVIVVDHTKFGTPDAHRICGFEEIDVIMTDEALPDEAAHFFSTQDIRVVCCNEQRKGES